MKKEKKTIIIVGLVIFCLYGSYMTRYFIQNSTPLPGDLGTTTLDAKNDFSPFTYKAGELNPLKITLSDTQASVIKILGEPKTIGKTQKLFPLAPANMSLNCQFLVYDNFFIIMREGRVAGWYFDPAKINNKSNLIYLPGLKTQEESTFFAFYKNWENLSSQSYAETFSNFGKYNLGKIYFCEVWGDKTSGSGEMVIYAYSEKYKAKQMYLFDASKLVSKVIGAEDLTLIDSKNASTSMFLGRNLAYIKNYFAAAKLEREKQEIGPEGGMIYVISFLKDKSMYRFDFKEKDECVNVAISYE